jgi:DNA replication protein DnaC
MSDDLAEWLADRREARLQALRKRVPVRYHNARVHLAGEDPKIQGWVRDTLAAQPKGSSSPASMRGQSLLILGPTGVGKTHKAMALAFHLAEHGGGRMPVAEVVTAADLYDQMRPGSGQDSETVFTRYATATLLLLDDLGAANTSPWVEEKTYRMVNNRYNNELITVFTSNVPPVKLGETLGERVASRLTEMCTVVVLKGEDRRLAS